MEQVSSNAETIPEGHQIKLWPNPARDFLYCTVPDVSPDLTLRITDPVGREIINQVVNEKKFHINVAEFKPGVYILKLISAEMQITKLFLKD
jgi:hypothetical protein